MSRQKIGRLLNKDGFPEFIGRPMNRFTRSVTCTHRNKCKKTGGNNNTGGNKDEREMSPNEREDVGERKKIKNKRTKDGADERLFTGQF